MSFTFSKCSSLKELELSNFKTNNVKNMSNLKKLNLFSFNTNNVQKMISMFEDWSSLEDLDISNFNNPKIIYDDPLHSIFKGCLLLKHPEKLEKKFKKQKVCICFCKIQIKQKFLIV